MTNYLIISEDSTGINRALVKGAVTLDEAETEVKEMAVRNLDSKFFIAKVETQATIVPIQVKLEPYESDPIQVSEDPEPEPTPAPAPKAKTTK